MAFAAACWWFDAACWVGVQCGALGWCSLRRAGGSMRRAGLVFAAACWWFDAACWWFDAACWWLDALVAVFAQQPTIDVLRNDSAIIIISHHRHLSPGLPNSSCTTSASTLSLFANFTITFRRAVFREEQSEAVYMHDSDSHFVPHTACGSCGPSTNHHKPVQPSRQPSQRGRTLLEP